LKTTMRLVLSGIQDTTNEPTERSCTELHAHKSTTKMPCLQFPRSGVGRSKLRPSQAKRFGSGIRASSASDIESEAEQNDTKKGRGRRVAGSKYCGFRNMNLQYGYVNRQQTLSHQNQRKTNFVSPSSSQACFCWA